MHIATVITKVRIPSPTVSPIVILSAFESPSPPPLVLVAGSVTSVGEGVNDWVIREVEDLLTISVVEGVVEVEVEVIVMRENWSATVRMTRSALCLLLATYVSALHKQSDRGEKCNEC